MRASEDHQIVPAVVGLVCGVSIVSQCEAKLRMVDGWVVHSVQMQCSGDNTVTVTHSPTLHRAWLGSPVPSGGWAPSGSLPVPS